MMQISRVGRLKRQLIPVCTWPDQIYDLLMRSIEPGARKRHRKRTTDPKCVITLFWRAALVTIKVELDDKE